MEKHPIEEIVLGKESVTFKCAGKNNFVVTAAEVSNTIAVADTLSQEHIAETQEGFTPMLREATCTHLLQWAAGL